MKTFTDCYHGSPIAQLEEQGIRNLRVASSSPALGAGRNGPLVHPTVKWIHDILTRLRS